MAAISISSSKRAPALLRLFLLLQLLSLSTTFMAERAAGDQIKLTVSRCNECIAAGVSYQCDYVFRIHWGDNNLGSCADSQAPFTDTSYNSLYPNTKINTPHGQTSNYQLVNGNAQVNQLKSRIISPDGSTYDCYVADGAQFTRKCAVYCNVGLSCYGPS